MKPHFADSAGKSPQFVSMRLRRVDKGHFLLATQRGLIMALPYMVKKIAAFFACSWHALRVGLVDSSRDWRVLCFYKGGFSSLRVGFRVCVVSSRVYIVCSRVCIVCSRAYIVCSRACNCAAPHKVSESFT